MKRRVTALAAVVIAAALLAGSGATAPDPDAGLIIFTTTWITQLDADPSHDSPPDVTSILCGVDLTGRTYRLTEPDVWSAPPADPSWAPDGIHWAATYAGHVPGLVTYGVGFGGLDGRGRAGPDGSSVSWSPDGTQIAYSPAGTQGIAVAPADAGRAGGPVRFAHGRGRASWSPDGSELAFSEGADVHVARLDGGGDRLLLSNAREPDWSPDGRSLVVGRVPAGGGDETLAVLGTDGGGLHDLGIAGDGPVWSPSGRMLAYVDPRGGIAAVAADGSSRHVLFRSRGSGGLDWQPVAHPELLAGRPPCAVAPPPDVHTIDGSAVADNIWGTRTADTIRAAAGDDVVGADGGSDLVEGEMGADQIDGGPGNDRLDGDQGNDLLRGGSGNDRIAGGTGTDTIDGGPGDDLIVARDGEPDTIACGPGHDVVIGDPTDHVSSDCEVIRGPDLLLGDLTPPVTYESGKLISELTYVNGHMSFRVTVGATDAGSGVARVWVEGPRGRVIASRPGHCRPTAFTRVRRGRACDGSVEFTFTIHTRALPEGFDRFRVVAVDAAGHRGGRAGWGFNVDRTGPRAHGIDVWSYDRLHHTAWIEIPTLGGDRGGSGVNRLAYRYRVTTMRWSRWIDPDAGSRDTLTPVIEATGVLPGDVVHAQIKETDVVGNVGPPVELAVRVLGTEHNLTDLPPEAGPDGPPVVNLDGPATWAGYAGSNDSFPLTIEGESSFGVRTVSLDVADTGRIVASGTPTCADECPFSYTLSARIDARTLPEGVATFVGRTEDAKGRTAASPKLRLAVDRTPPPAPRFLGCGWSSRRAMAAIGWSAPDPRLPDGAPGSGTAHLLFRYRTGPSWSRWRRVAEAPTLYVHARLGDRVEMEAKAQDLVGNASRLGHGTVAVLPTRSEPGTTRAAYPCNS